jgi:hypothetical protein
VLVLRMALSAGGVWGDGLVRELMQFVDALVAEDQGEVTPRESKDSSGSYRSKARAFGLTV